MPISILIPTPLRKITADADVVTVDAGTVGEIIDGVDRIHPGFRDRICGADGKLRRFINIYINGEDIRFLENLQTPVSDGAEVSIVPAIAGG
ncbi:MAG: molybdopterin synthase sulfur carrier subunit [Blastocatellia bacterium AA13]|nr:MAG: molybdopterin synthase sulfur carrier subunit [Blastocatellia bacterium AA13]